MADATPKTPKKKREKIARGGVGTKGQVKGRRGATPLINEERIDRIVTAIQAGNFYEPAAKFGGITYSSLRNWMKRGELEFERREDGEEPNLDEDLYVKIFEGVTRAETESEMYHVLKWRDHADADWRASSEFLARRHSSRWARKDEMVVRGDAEQPILVRLVAGLQEETLKKIGEKSETVIDVEANE